MPHAGQTVEERALAGAVGADDGADLVATHREIDMVQRGQAAEPDGQRLGAQDRLLAIAARPLIIRRAAGQRFYGH